MSKLDLKIKLQEMIQQHIARLTNILENQSKLISEKNSLLSAKQKVDKSLYSTTIDRNTYNKEIQDRSEKIQELQAEIRENKKSNEEFKKKLERHEELEKALQKNMTSIEKLTKAKKNILVQLEKMKVEKNDLNTKIEEKNLEIKALKEEKDSYESQLKVSKQENESKLKEIERLEISLKSFENGEKLDVVKDSQIKSLREELDLKNRELIERNRVYDTMIDQLKINDSDILEMFSKFQKDANQLFDKAESELQFSTTSAEAPYQAPYVSALTNVLANANTNDTNITDLFNKINGESTRLETGLVLNDIEKLIKNNEYEKIPMTITHKTNVLKDRCHKKGKIEYCELIKLFDELSRLINVVISQSNLQNTKQQIEKEDKEDIEDIENYLKKIKDKKYDCNNIKNYKVPDLLCNDKVNKSSRENIYRNSARYIHPDKMPTDANPTCVTNYKNAWDNLEKANECNKNKTSNETSNKRLLLNDTSETEEIQKTSNETSNQKLLLNDTSETEENLRQEKENKEQKYNDATSSEVETNDASSDEEEYNKQYEQYYNTKVASKTSEVASEETEDASIKRKINQQINDKLNSESDSESDSEPDVATETSGSESIEKLKTKIENLIETYKKDKNKKILPKIMNSIENNLKNLKSKESLNNLKKSIEELIRYSKYCENEDLVTKQKLSDHCKIRELAQQIIRDIDNILKPQPTEEASEIATSEVASETSVENVLKEKEKSMEEILKSISSTFKTLKTKLMDKKNNGKEKTPNYSNGEIEKIIKYKSDDYRELNKLLVEQIVKIKDYCTKEDNKKKVGYKEYCEIYNLFVKLVELLNSDQ